ncbi:MAG: ribose 5-phosphate isomerase B [Anaerolineae bacterium]|nr:ribose 5-phosphate isomerase B [Anaerolineae bacterium]
MKIIVGSDYFGRALKDDLKAYLEELGHEVVDAGAFDDAPIDYPDVAEAVAQEIAAGNYERGVLVCGTGIGMAMVANKIPGVRAACCHDPYSAERARKSNDAQIITMGAQVIGPMVARSLLDIWLAAEFAGGRSALKVDKIKALDERYRKLAP